MDNTPPQLDDVLVVGAGPVGTALALDLAQRGRSVRVLEARTTRPPGSRAIGVHPPGLQVLQHLGLAEAIVREGVRVKRGRALGTRGGIGTLALDALSPPFDFVLTVPQGVTERLLRDALHAIAPNALEEGVTVHTVQQDAAAVTATARNAAGETHTYRARVLVACDGRDGVVRTQLGIGRTGGPYPDTYAMADLPELNALARDEAVIALHRDGVVEGFPLPGGVRRWVVALGVQHSPEADDIAAFVAARVRERTGFSVEATAVGTATRFGVERYLAHAFARGRVLLAGDAAHVISPIGGQGMNLGWLDGAAYARAIDEHLDDAPAMLTTALAQVAAIRRAKARRALQRAEANTRLGRAVHPSWGAVRDTLLALYLRPPWAAAARARFTMGGLA